MWCFENAGDGFETRYSETVDAIGFGHLFDVHQAVANSGHVGAGGQSDGEGTGENAVVGVEMNGFEHEMGKISHGLRDAHQHARRVDPFHVDGNVV